MTTRLRPVLAAAVLAALALTGCSGDGDDVATDPGGTQESPGSQEPEPAEPPEPAGSPTVGSYASYEPTDYRFTLRVTCYCPDAGLPIRVTVARGEVASAVYDAKRGGIGRGDPAPKHRALTIDDVIDLLNAAVDAETVRVDWPEGQAYPTDVWIDRDSRMADEEIGYTISEVEVD